MRPIAPLSLAGLLLIGTLPAPPAGGQAPPLSRPFCRNLIVPQARARSLDRTGSVAVTSVEARVVIAAQVATTTLDITLRNPGTTRAEAELLVPVPAAAAVRGFTFEGAGSEPAVELLPRAEAGRLYEEVVSRLRDPALAEFLGQELVRTSLFPVDAGGEQTVRLVYDEVLAADGERVDYVLSRTESLAYDVPWRISLEIRDATGISTLYSPSHPIETTRKGPAEFAAEVPTAAARTPGPFRISYLRDRGSVTASLLAYPEGEAGSEDREGYFLLLAGLGAAPPAAEAGTLRREVTFVIDRSGSMQGEKIEQARSAALQVLAGLEDGEAFNVVSYNDTVSLFSPAPVTKDAKSLARARAYLKGLRAEGGTNLHDALAEALRAPAPGGMLPLVLFLTDGLPTVGQTSEVAIRNLARDSNPQARRVFTFGVGVDVNTPLLDRIATETRSSATYVLPGEDLEVKVSRVFRHLRGPVIAAPALRCPAASGANGAGGESGPPRVHDLLPSRLPDLFEGDQLVVLGRYRGTDRLRFVLEGNYRGAARRFEFTFDLDAAAVRNAFVPRLWASRKIAVLADAIRQLGAESPAVPGAPDPRLAELVDEIVRLSSEFGVLTEYTAFLARESTDLSRPADVVSEATRNFLERAVASRTGLGAVSQGLNIALQANAVCLNRTNRFLDAEMNHVEVTSLQQVCDRTFYRRGGCWVDARLLASGAVEPDRTVEVGSPEFHELAARLAAQGRQGCAALEGDVVLRTSGETVLLRARPSE